MGNAATRAVSRDVQRVIAIVLYALRQGANYGAKIRVPHAVLMAALYRRHRSLADNALEVATVGWEHARNLAYFVALYKLAVAVLRAGWAGLGLPAVLASPASGAPPLADGQWLSDVATPSHPMQAALAGALAAGLVWSHFTPVNQQILLFVLSRVVLAGARALASHGVEPFASISFETAYPLLAVATWAAVMALFEYEPSSLQPSLLHSMTALYHTPDVAPSLSWLQFRPSPTLAAAAAYLAVWTWQNHGSLQEMLIVRGVRARPS